VSLSSKARAVRGTGSVGAPSNRGEHQARGTPESVLKSALPVPDHAGQVDLRPYHRAERQGYGSIRRQAVPPGLAEPRNVRNSPVVFILPSIRKFLRNRLLFLLA